MKTIVYRVIVNSGKEEEFEKLARKVLIPEALRTRGCKFFSLYKSLQNKREYIFYEVWDNLTAIATYKKSLIALLGPNKPGEEFPMKLNSFFEKEEDVI